MKSIINLLINMLLAKEYRKQTVVNKHKLGSYKTHTRYNAFKRAPRPDLHPARYPNESQGSYRKRRSLGNQWAAEMKLGGAHYV
jgi:hypothetical protein